MAIERDVFFAVGNVINNTTSWTTLTCAPFDTTYGVVSIDANGRPQPLLGASVHVDILAVNHQNNTATVVIAGVSPTTGTPISREIKVKLNDSANVFIPELQTSIICGIADLDPAKVDESIARVNAIAGTDFITASGPQRGGN